MFGARSSGGPGEVRPDIAGPFRSGDAQDAPPLLHYALRPLVDQVAWRLSRDSSRWDSEPAVRTITAAVGGGGTSSFVGTVVGGTDQRREWITHVRHCGNCSGATGLDHYDDFSASLTVTGTLTLVSPAAGSSSAHRNL